MNYEKYAIVDLHLHLDGSLSPEIIIEIAKEENIELPTYNPIELRSYLQVPNECDSLVEYLKRFDIPNYVLQTKNGLRKCMLDLLKRLSKQGIKYAEIRMAPQLSTAKGLTQDEVVKTLIDASLEARKLFGIKSNLIVCMMRFENNNKENMETVKVARKYLNKGVCLLDIAGAEALYPVSKYAELFMFANELGVPFTIHSGEDTGYQSVVESLKFGPVRIGHGVHSYQSEELMKYLAENKIPLEICPKSNMDTKAIKSFKELPVELFLSKGILVTINTDDMTVSNTNLKNEYRILAEELGLNDEKLLQIAVNSINASRLSNEEKRELIDSLI